MSKPSGKICYQQLVTGSSYTSLFMSQIATEAITLRVRGCLDYILPCGDVLYCFSFTEETPAALAAHPVSSAYPGHSRTACLISIFWLRQTWHTRRLSRSRSLPVLYVYEKNPVDLFHERFDSSGTKISAAK